jgi:hypothetical protein
MIKLLLVAQNFCAMQSTFTALAKGEPETSATLQP